MLKKVHKLYLASPRSLVKRFHYHLPDQDVDQHIHMMQGADSSLLTLTQPFTAYGMTIPIGFTWNGASSPPGPGRWVIPKFHRMIKASCRHDYACQKARNRFERFLADIVFFLMAAEIERLRLWRCILGLIGVRIGAYLKIGSNY